MEVYKYMIFDEFKKMYVAKEYTELGIVLRLEKLLDHYGIEEPQNRFTIHRKKLNPKILDIE